MRFPTWFRDASIRRKFIFIAFLATLTATLFAILLSTLMQWFMLREELLKSISAQASLIAANSAAELVHNDREGAKKTVGALANIDNIEFAGILDKRGNNFAYYTRPGSMMPPHQHLAVEGEHHTLTMKYVEIVTPVVLKQEHIGIIHVRSNLAPVYEKLGWNILLTIAAAAGAFLAAVIMLLRLLPAITDPLQYLIGLINTMSRDNNFTLRSELHDNDEMGMLAKGFNTMLGQIQSRDVELTRYRENLEAEVALRTDRLTETHRIAHLGNWEWDIVNNTLDWSDEIYRIFGFTPQQFDATYESFMQAVHPEDRQSVETGVREALELQRPYSIDHRILLPDGTVRHVHEHADITRNKDGQAIKMLGTVQDITERKQMELRLQESEQRFRNLAELTTDWVWQVDEHGTYVYSGEKVYDLLGYTPEEVCGKTPFDFMPQEEAARVAEIFKDIAGKQIPFSFLENMNLHKDGHRVILETSGVPLFSDDGIFQGYFGTEHDITERKQAEQALEESECRFRTILDVAVDGILLADVQSHKFISGNRAIFEMLGYQPDELYQLSVEDIHPSENLPKVQKQFDRQMKGEIRVAQNLPVKRKDGSIFFSDVSSAPMTLAGQTIMVGFFHDVTERKQAEEEITLLATTDSLTGIANRRAFNMQLEKEIERAKRYATPLSLLMYDIDYFKRVNDTFGHDTGDCVLQTLTAVVKENIRSVDVVARWGGEEFMILMPQSDGTAAGDAAEKLRQKIARHTFEQVGSLTVSFGVTEFVPDDDSNAFLKRVDDALYRAKEKGRNRIEILREKAIS